MHVLSVSQRTEHASSILVVDVLNILYSNALMLTKILVRGVLFLAHITSFLKFLSSRLK